MDNNRPYVGLGVLIFNHKNQILLGKRIGAHGDSTWGPPGGHLEFGESLEACAIREVKEETNLDIRPPKFLALTNDLFEKEEKHYVSIFLEADYIEGQEIKNCEPNKISEWQWFDLNALPSNLFLPLTQLLSDRFYGDMLKRRAA